MGRLKIVLSVFTNPIFYSLSLLLIFAITPLSSGAAEVKNDSVRQVGNRILFEFDVEGDYNEDADVGLTLTIKGRLYTADQLHLEGDRGKIKTGQGKKIYWNVLQDFPRGLNITVHWNLTAGGGKLVKDPTTGIEMIFVKGGCYEMGCGSWTTECSGEEKPVHEVCVDDFYMGKYDVTQGQWQAIMGNNPSNFKNCGDNCPVEQVSWNDAQEFISKLNGRSGGNKYRLPTEAEWEYAARSGGKSEKYAGGIDVDSVAWYSSNSGSTTHPVGAKSPNGLGLYDMSGNVWQWIEDWYGANYYGESPKNNPQGPGSGQYRVLRGGSWINNPVYERAARRYRHTPTYRSLTYGFRLALSAR